MEQTTVAQPGTVAIEPPSTVLNPETVSQPSGAGKPDLSEGQSIQDVLENELKTLREAEAKAEADDKAAKATEDAKAKADGAKDGDKDEKPEKAAKEPDKDQAKAKRDETGKFAKAEDKPKADESAAEKPAAGQEATEKRQSEGRHPEPPARFLPEARTKWANVPNEVKAEVHRVAQEYEAELTRHKAQAEAYEQVREYDEMAKRSGTTLKDALARFTGMENMLRQNPAQGIAAVLKQVGTTPEQYAKHVLANPQQHRFQQAPQPQQPAPIPKEVADLQKSVQAMQAQLVTARAQPIIERFASEHPDYHALETQIAKILGSGVIEQIYGTGLSPEQRLEQAYRMAGGSSPSRSVPEPAPTPSGVDAPRPENLDAGRKSVRGAPDDGTDPKTEETETDLREMLRKELRRIA